MISMPMSRQHPRVLRTLLLVAAVVFLGTASAGRAGDAKLDQATLQKVKQATVHLQVKLIDGSIAQGSGFLSEAPGVILTNAHVLGMLAADSRRPLEIIAVIRSGDAKSQRLTPSWRSIATPTWRPCASRARTCPRLSRSATARA